MTGRSVRDGATDVADANAEGLARQRERQGKLGSVVDLNLANRERKGGCELAEEREAR
jgi:hypothetical protein